MGRVTEIKHGRVSMLATMGYITPELVGKFPGYLSPSNGLKFEDVPNGLAAISKVPGLGWLQILAYGLFCEYSVGLDQEAQAPPDERRSRGHEEALECRDRQRPSRDDGYHWDVLSGRSDRLSMGRLGSVHGLASEGQCLRPPLLLRPRCRSQVVQI